MAPVSIRQEQVVLLEGSNVSLIDPSRGKTCSLGMEDIICVGCSTTPKKYRLVLLSQNFICHTHTSEEPLA